MDTTYNPQAIEQRWYAYWEQHKLFVPSGKGEPYCIMIPPPNVTGTLHMGHAFQDTVMDILIRYHRMRGRNTLWQPGTDHAGIATQMVVERQLQREGKTRHDLGREAFVDRVWQWKAESGDTIGYQLRRLGASVDWSRERFTMDEGMSAAVREVFVRLYEAGLIYRGKRLVNWDPVLHTALSDIEVLSEEEDGHLWHFRYPLSDGGGHLTVATTRPETMLGDTAVAVHPDDERFTHLVGRTLTLPLVKRQIPVIADDYVDPQFGTGCVKITPAHDFNDHAVGLRHRLDVINVFTDDARLNDAVPAAYRGLDRYTARERVVADLERIGLMERVERHRLMVPRGDRSGAVVEPYLTDQWFVDLTRSELPDGRPGGAALITRPAIEAVRAGRVDFVPPNWANTYFQWLDNVQDWCISRQLWWGHRIPAWYDHTGKLYVAIDEDAVRRKYALPADVELIQDEDVLDTWFSSALWPFSTLGWPEKTEALSTFYPGAVLVTGFDIIFFWVARMIMFGTRFMQGEVPFREIYMHGLVRDANGQKMSKSKGNVLDPLDIIDGIDIESLVKKRTSSLMQDHLAPKIEAHTRRDFPQGIPAYGTDALRYTFASLASTGRDVRFDLKRVEGYRNFCNKLYNACRFVLMNTEDFDPAAGAGAPSAIDHWIESRLSATARALCGHLKHYRFDLASSALYEFVWNDYCDWYLEMAKATLNSDPPAATVQSVKMTLLRVLEQTLRLAHPFIPFITEELWQSVAPRAGVRGDSISLAHYPLGEDASEHQAIDDIEWLRQVVMGVRRIRSEMNINPGKKLPLLIDGGSATDRQRVVRYRELLVFLARLAAIDELREHDAKPQAAVALVDDLQLLIPMAGLIDRESELKRLDRELAKLSREVGRLEEKLANAGFAAKAPPAVVAAERQKHQDAQAALARLSEQQARIASLE